MLVCLLVDFAVLNWTLCVIAKLQFEYQLVKRSLSDNSLLEEDVDTVEDNSFEEEEQNF